MYTVWNIENDVQLENCSIPYFRAENVFIIGFPCKILVKHFLCDKRLITVNVHGWYLPLTNFIPERITPIIVCPLDKCNLPLIYPSTIHLSPVILNVVFVFRFICSIDCYIINDSNDEKCTFVIRKYKLRFRLSAGCQFFLQIDHILILEIYLENTIQCMVLANITYTRMILHYINKIIIYNLIYHVREKLNFVFFLRKANKKNDWELLKKTTTSCWCEMLKDTKYSVGVVNRKLYAETLIIYFLLNSQLNVLGRWKKIK